MTKAVDDAIEASVIIPAYNAERYIRKAVESVLSGSEIGLEVLVVEDKSTDRTREVVADIAQADTRVRLIALDENRGESHARNIGISEARGEWIAQLDADDWYASGRLETLIELGESRRADIVADNQFWILPNAPRPWRSLFPINGAAPRKFSLQEFLELDVVGSAINPGYLQPIIRRSFLAKTGITYDESFRVGIDFLFLAQCLFEADELFLCDNPTYYYLTREGSVSNTVETDDLKKLNAANERLIAEIPARHGNNIRTLLQRRGDSIENAIRHKQIFDKAKRWNFLGAAMAIAQDPGIMPFSLRSIFRGVRSRLRKRFSLIGGGTHSKLL